MSVVKRSKAIQCRFLWDNFEERRKFHLVAWDEIKRPLHQDGLGLRSGVAMNQTLQDKWIWRFIKENDILW